MVMVVFVVNWDIAVSCSAGVAVKIGLDLFCCCVCG